MGVKDVVEDNKKFLILVILLLVVSIGVIIIQNSGLYTSLNPLPVWKDTYTEPEDFLEPGVDYTIAIKTDPGEIVIDLYENDAPRNVNSLLFLISKRYYEQLTFHKVINNFVIQAGDANGDGTGDPGYIVGLENTSAEFTDYSVGMANASQFFIVLPGSDKNDFNGKYTLVGKVIKGTAVVDSIARVEVDDNYKPLNDVKINSIQILE
jgi:cyclophilin family peptidyl-prolyl cis-trans isomerase